MPLSEAKIRSAKPSPKPRKISDALGLYVFLTPSGSKLFRMDYQMRGRRRTLSFGAWPGVTLSDARRRREDARLLLQRGLDPSDARRAERMTAPGNIFGDLSEEWLEKLAKENRSAKTLERARHMLRNLAAPLHDRPLGEISAPEILALLRRAEKGGHFETARRLRSTIGRVFRYAIASGRASIDPSAALVGAIVAPTVKHRAAILDPAILGDLLRKIDAYHGEVTTRYALRLLPALFCRPSEIRLAEWSEFDIEGKVWTIPSSRAKMRRAQRVPLSRQVIENLRQLHMHTGHARLLFPSNKNPKKPISESTLGWAMRRMGIARSVATPHGWRASAATMLSEMNRWPDAAIELSLAHVERSTTRRSYHRQEHWPERVDFMQTWADHLETLKNARDSGLSNITKS